MGDDFDPVGFFVGSVVAAAGAALTILSAGTLAHVGAVVAGFGIEMMRGAIRGRPDRQSAQQAHFSTDASLKVVYGRTRVGVVGSDIWVDHDDVSDHQSLWTFVAFCLGSEDGSGVEDVEKIWFDDILAVQTVSTGSQTNGRSGVTNFYDESELLTYNVRRGTHTQSVNTDAQSAASNASDRYPNSFRGRGICYAAFNMWKHKDKFTNYPRSIVGLIKGNRVYDPRHTSGGPNNDGWCWDSADSAASENPGQNPALILLDYLTSAKYGADVFYPERDGGDTSLSEIDEQSFIDAANYCDEQVQDGSGGTQARFKFNDWLDTGNSLQENIRALESAMRGKLIHQQGEFRLVIPQTQSSVMTLSEDDIIGDWSFHRAGSRKVPNRVVGKFPGGSNGEVNEEVQFPDESDTTFLDQDNGIPQVRTVEMYGVDDPVRAEQILMVNLRQAREDAGVSFRATERAAQLEVGDVFTLDHSTPGWTDGSTKDFRVVQLVMRPDFTVQVTAKEYADSAYSLDSQTRPTPPPGSNLPDPTNTPAPTNLSLTSDGTTQINLPGGDKVPGILATWDLPTDEGIDRAVIVERKDGDSDWNRADTVEPTDTQRSLFSPKGATQGDSWEVGVYVVVGQRQRASTKLTGTTVVGVDFDPSSTVNLLGEDAGPPHSGTGFEMHVYEATVPIEALQLEAGEVFSFGAYLKSATGSDSVRVSVQFLDSSGTQIQRNNTPQVTSSTYERAVQEDSSVPASADTVKVWVNNVDNTEQASVKRAMVNFGPVLGPYTDPPPLDAENLLGFDALVEQTWTGSHQYLDAPLSDLGLSVGDVVTCAIDVKTDGTAGAQGRTLVRFFDAGDSQVGGDFDTEGTVAVTTYERPTVYGIVVPDNAATIQVFADNVPNDSSTYNSRRAMLNRGPRAAPFSGPDFKWDRDDWGDVPDDILDQTGFTGDNMPRDPGGGGTVPTVQDASRMGAADLTSDTSYVLFWSDTDTNSSGGIVVGAMEENTTLGDFNVQMGGETQTVPGSQEPASAEETYHVYWIEGGGSVSISTDKSDAIGYDRVYLGRITTGQDITGGGSDPGGDTGGDGDFETIK